MSEGPILVARMIGLPSCFHLGVRYVCVGLELYGISLNNAAVVSGLNITFGNIYHNIYAILNHTMPQTVSPNSYSMFAVLFKYAPLKTT